MKVFLGGTCNGSQWRQEIISKLKPGVEFYDPVVPEWNAEAQARELYERENCDVCLYVITPAVSEFYVAAEAADDSNRRPTKTVFCYLLEDHVTDQIVKTFHEVQIKSLNAVGDLVKRNGGLWLFSLDDVAKYLNSKA